MVQVKLISSGWLILHHSKAFYSPISHALSIYLYLPRILDSLCIFYYFLYLFIYFCFFFVGTQSLKTALKYISVLCYLIFFYYVISMGCCLSERDVDRYVISILLFSNFIGAFVVFVSTSRTWLSRPAPMFNLSVVDLETVAASSVKLEDGSITAG